MASVDRPGFASFTTLQLPPQPPGPYQTVGLLLKIAGWVRLVLLILTAAFGLLALAMLALAGAVGGVITTLLLGPFGGLAGLAAGFVLIVATVAILVILAFHAGMTYWTSWIYARWVAKDPRVPQHLFTYALVTTILAGLGVLGSLGGNPAGIVDIGMLVVGILLLVNAQDPQIKHMGAPATREEWKVVE